MAEQALNTAVGPAQKTQTASGALSGAFMPRVITGFAILLTWELVVRAFAPAYVAKPTTVILAIPKVITEPAFLQALGSESCGGGRRTGDYNRHRHSPWTADGPQHHV